MAYNNYNDLLKSFVNKSYDELLSIANASLATVMPMFNEIAEDGNGAGIVLPFICTSLAVDGKFSELEYQFVKDLLEIDQSYDYFKGVIADFYSDEWFNAVDALLDSCPEEIKTALLAFCLAFVSVDETITREENQFIAKLMG